MMDETYANVKYVCILHVKKKTSECIFEISKYCCKINTLKLLLMFHIIQYKFIHGIQGLLGKIWRSGKEHHKESDFHSNICPGTLSWCGNDDIKMAGHE